MSITSNWASASSWNDASTDCTAAAGTYDYGDNFSPPYHQVGVYEIVHDLNIKDVQESKRARHAAREFQLAISHQAQENSRHNQRRHPLPRRQYRKLSDVNHWAVRR